MRVSPTLKHPKKGYEKLTRMKARLIGHCIGDGAVFKTKHDYVIKYEVKDLELLEIFREALLKVYGLEPSFYWRRSGKTGVPIPLYRLRSKLVYEDLVKHTSYYSYLWQVPQCIKNADKSIVKEFLRALFDDEGSITRKQLRLYSVNEQGLREVQQLLKNFGIKSQIVRGFGAKRNVAAIVIKDLKSILIFSKEINFMLQGAQN